MAFLQEFTEIAVDVSIENSVLRLIPLNSEAREKLAQALMAGEEFQVWHFAGSRYETESREHLSGVNYVCGGHQEEVKDGNVTMYKWLDGMNIYLDFSAATDEHATYSVRDFGYFTGGMRVLEGSTPDAVLFAANAVCKVCEGSLTSFVEVEWKTCNSCSSQCQHDYVEGVGQANGQLAYLPFCKKCGRGDPNWQPNEDPTVDLFNTVTKGGVDILMLRDPSDGSHTVISKIELK